ncbi:MAG: hypothetical protein ACE5OR_14840 [bacterium]
MSGEKWRPLYRQNRHLLKWALIEEEAWHFIDGRRNLFDIYQAVDAEAISCGYERMPLETFEEFFEAAEKVGIVELK